MRVQSSPERLYELEYDGKVVRGCWGAAADSHSHRWGRFEFTSDADGNAFSGKYGDGNADLTNTWNGSRSSLTDLPDSAPPAPELQAVEPEVEAEREPKAEPGPEPEPEPEPGTPASPNVDGDLETLKEQMRREAEEAAALRRAAEEEMAAAARQQAEALENAMADKALATSTLLQEMSEIRLELAQAEKGFSDKLHDHSETIDGQIKHLETELHEQLPEVAAVRESLVNLKDSMQDKVDKQALERLEQLIAANTGSTDGSSQPTQSVPELTGILGAIDEMKSGLSNKADFDMLQRMETQLLQQVHDLIAKVAEEAAANQPIPEPAEPSAGAPSQEALQMINGMLADLAALREELTYTQAKLSEAEQKAIDHAAETARMFFNAKQQELEDMLKAMQADRSQPDEASLQPVSLPAPAVDLDGLVRDEQLRESLDTKADVGYCDELFRQLEEQLQEHMQNQSGADNAVMSSGSTELKIFKRSWWETMQAQINQKASNRDIQQLRAQVSQLQAAQVGDNSSRPSTRGSMSRARTPVSGVPRPTAGDSSYGLENPTGEAGTGRLVNAANASVAGSLPGGKKGATLSSAEPQMHVVVGEFPSKTNPRMSRSLGGGAVALRADDEIVFLQNRLEEKLTVLKKMYDNKGWGVRGATVLNAASMLAEPLDMSRGGLPADASTVGALPTRSLWSRNSHQRAMKRIGGSGGAGPHGSGGASALGRRQLYPMDYGGGASGMGFGEALPFRSITGQVSPIGASVNSQPHLGCLCATGRVVCQTSHSYSHSYAMCCFWQANWPRQQEPS